MLLIRRLWLAPAFVITVLIYFFFWRDWQGEDHHYGKHLSDLHLDPSKYKEVHPVESYLQIPPDTARWIPKIQHDFTQSPETAEAKKVRLERLEIVKESFAHTWSGYREHAWAKDEVSPLSGDWRNSFGGWGATLVDTLDTLWVMRLKKEFEEAVAAVEKIDFTTNTEDILNVFETTIRYLGGLLSAYDLSEGKYPALLEKAKELGEILYLSFDTPNRMPVTRWRWAHTAMGQELGFASDYTLIAELGSLTLEFTRLSQITRDPKYFDAVQRIAHLMAQNQDNTKVPGLWPTVMDAKALTFNYNHFTLGGMADSAYEYLPKQFMLLGGVDSSYITMYVKAVEKAKERLFYRPLTPQNVDILLSGNTGVDESGQVATQTQGQHLTCFAGGMLAIAAQIFSRPDDLPIARKLVDGCIWAYKSMPSGLMPELFDIAHCHIGVTPDPHSGIDPSNITEACAWSDDRYYEAVYAVQDKENVAALTHIEAGKWWVRQKGLIPPYTNLKDTRYILRPEAIESIFILYRITGDPSLLEAAWTMFQSIDKATRTDIAYAAVFDVRQEHPAKQDRMESFWLAETLKYFYLIFSEPDVLSLDEFVLNTEAHPFKRPKPGMAL